MSEQGHVFLNTIMQEVARAGCSDEEKEKVLTAALAAVKGDTSKVIELIREGLAELGAPLSVG